MYVSVVQCVLVTHITSVVCVVSGDMSYGVCA